MNIHTKYRKHQKISRKHQKISRKQMKYTNSTPATIAITAKFKILYIQQGLKITIY